MFKSIAQLSPDLRAFIQSLNLPLLQAQEQHITQVADAMVTIKGRKTLSSLYRAILHFRLIPPTGGIKGQSLQTR